MSMRRSAAVKLLGGETGGGITLFDENPPASTETTFHLCRRAGTPKWIC
jgi:hypothetical protein